MTLTARQFAQSLLTPAQWQAQVMKWARDGGWLAYHTYDSRRSVAGFPDVILLRGKRGIAAELKCGSGRLSGAQAEWLMAFQDAGFEVYEWRPEDGDRIRALLLEGVDVRSAVMRDSMSRLVTRERNAPRRNPRSVRSANRKGRLPDDAARRF